VVATSSFAQSYSVHESTGRRSSGEDMYRSYTDSLR
jgi:hypothetical protein